MNAGMRRKWRDYDRLGRTINLMHILVYSNDVV